MRTLLPLSEQLSDQTSPKETQPTTLRGIKKKAKKLGHPGQSHSKALDLAAQLAGYRNYKHAWQELSPAESQEPSHASPRQQPSTRHPLFLTAYWLNTDVTPEAFGSETLQIELNNPLRDLLAGQQISAPLHLKGFFIESADHIERTTNASNQRLAWRFLVHAALTLQLMDVTGLRPAASTQDLQALTLLRELPANDNLSLWIEPESGTWIALDEPWRHRISESDVIQRSEWITDHHLHVKKTSWAGLHLPGRTEPHLISPSEELLRKTSQILEALKPIATMPSDPVHTEVVPWAGTSASYYSQFISPARAASGIAREGRPGHRFGYEKEGVGYYLLESHPLSWRPKARLSLSDHAVLGDELKRLSISPIPAEAMARIRAIRFKLENWMFSEYPDHKRDERFHTYYAPYQTSPYGNPKEQLMALDRVLNILRTGYSDEMPITVLLNDVDSLWTMIATGAMAPL